MCNLKFDEYKSLSKERPVKVRFSRACLNRGAAGSDMSPLMQHIFAPDPITGIPSSDLAFVLSKDAAPEVSQYIRDNLMRPIGNTSSCEDADAALDMTKMRRETGIEYADRLRSLIDSYSNSEK